MVAPIDPHCRIGKIRAKNGGEFRVLPDVNAEWAHKVGNSLRDETEWWIGKFGKDLDGYVLVIWDRHGYWKCRRELGNKQHMTSAPTFVADALRYEQSRDASLQVLEDFLRNK